MNSFIRFQPEEVEDIITKMQFPDYIEFCTHRRMATRMAFTILLRRLSGNPRYYDLAAEFDLQPNLLSAANIEMIR